MSPSHRSARACRLSPHAVEERRRPHARDRRASRAAPIWRLRVAREHRGRSTRDGPFSSFPGVDRTLVLLAGNGMRLERRRAIRGPSHAVRARHVRGEAALDCALADGPTRDFNLMVRRARGVRAKCIVVRDEAAARRRPRRRTSATRRRHVRMPGRRLSADRGRGRAHARRLAATRAVHAACTSIRRRRNRWRSSPSSAAIAGAQ